MPSVILIRPAVRPQYINVIQTGQTSTDNGPIACGKPFYKRSPKRGLKLDRSNYRRVSLNSIYCKILESLIRDHIMSYLLENGLLSTKQCGFAKGRSTMLQLLCVQKKTSQPSPILPKDGHSSPLLFGPCLLWPNGRPSQLLLSTCNGCDCQF